MKKVISFLLSAVIACSTVFTALAVEESPLIGTPNSTALNYLSAVVRDKPLVDYVIYKTGDYTVKLVYGDITYENNVFSGSDLNVVVYNTRGYYYGTSYNQYAPTVSSSVDSITLTVDETSVIYSNLGNYASVERSIFRDEYFHFVVEFIGFILLFMSFFIFNRGRIHL